MVQPLDDLLVTHLTEHRSRDLRNRTDTPSEALSYTNQHP
jgi:hypothetical protein